MISEATLRNVWVETKSEIGSGVILQDNVVLANFHLLEVDSDIQVNNHPAKILAVDPEHDLALLSVETRILPSLKFSVKTAVGEAVHYVANTNGHRDFFSSGHIAFEDKNYLYTDTVALGGCSGGGLYNEQGELIGLNVGHEWHVIAYHIKARTILSFLEAHKELLK